jgi:hypothetical protein
MAGYDFIDDLINDLNIKITEILDAKKFPLIFILIGAYPGISQIHQSPPIIGEYIKDDNISPLIISFEPTYKINNTSLKFLTNTSDVEEQITESVVKDNDVNAIEENKWYYPHFVPKLKDSYKGKVGYKYLQLEINSSNINKIMSFLAKSKGIVFLWNFTSIEFRYDTDLPSTKLSVPPSDCMGNVTFNIEYNRCIKNTGPQEYELVNTETMIPLYMEEFKNLITIQLEDGVTVINHSRIIFLKGVIVNYIKTWFDWFKDIYIWENKVRLTDYRKLVTLSVSSPMADWFHYIYRSDMQYIITKLKKEFMSSKFHYFIEFLNNEIYNKVIMLITFDSYDFLDEMLTNKLTEESIASTLNYNFNVNVNKEEIVHEFHTYYSKKTYDFQEEFEIRYNIGITCNTMELPNIILNILQKNDNVDKIV